jgi:hypothetical protein
VDYLENGSKSYPRCHLIYQKSIRCRLRTPGSNSVVTFYQRASSPTFAPCRKSPSLVAINVPLCVVFVKSACSGASAI